MHDKEIVPQLCNITNAIVTMLGARPVARHAAYYGAAELKAIRIGSSWSVWYHEMSPSKHERQTM
jgi:hypothetical protein